MKLYNSRSDLQEFSKTIKISHYVRCTELLGPYNRFVLWVQGCCFKCKGCIAESMQSVEGGYDADIDEIAEIIGKQRNIEGITISGGEPFLQAEALNVLISAVKKKREDFGVIIYSGFTYEELIINSADNKAVRSLLALTDILIDGRYDILLDNGEFAKGSLNQKIVYLSDRYKKCGIQYYSQEKRKAEIVFYKNKSILTGVPSHTALEIWERIIK